MTDGKQEQEQENFNPNSFLNHDDEDNQGTDNTGDELNDEDESDLDDSESEENADNDSQEEDDDTSEDVSEDESEEEEGDFWGDEDDDDADDSSDDTDDSDSGQTQETEWRAVAQETGIEAETQEDFIAEVKRLKDAAVEANELKNQLNLVSQGANPVVTKLSNLLKLEDTELVKENLKAQGFSPEEIEEEYNALDDAGEITREALSIRRDIKVSIKEVVRNSANDAANREANIKAEQDKLYQSVNEELSKINDFMGTKLGKDDKQAANLRSKAFQDYTSGKMFSEMTKSPEAIAQLALLWSLKDKLGSRLESKGANRERKRIVTEVFGNAENKGGRTGVGKQPSTSFDPSAFLDM